MKRLLSILLAVALVFSLGLSAYSSGEASGDSSEEAASASGEASGGSSDETAAASDEASGTSGEASDSSGEASGDSSEEVPYEVEEGAIFLNDSGEYSYRERALDLVSRMTLEEKASLMGNSMPAIPRLGVEAYNVWSEALHGVGSGNCTSYPISVAMGSAWNRELVAEVAESISLEGRAYYNLDLGGFTGGGLTFWSPVVEPMRDPRWGRTAESYSEDTYLTSELAGQFVTGMMGDDGDYYRTVPCGKHFIANNIEVVRQTGSSKLTETELYEYYIKVYRDLITKYSLPSIMTAYNRVNNVPVSASVTLVDTLVRKMWGLDGYVTGDCGAVGLISSSYNYVGSRFADLEQSNSALAVALSLIAGVDSNCIGGSAASYIAAVENGYIPEAELDEALVNMFTIRFALGEFDGSTPWDGLGEEMIENEDEMALALKAAKETIVLLENNGILPLDAQKLEGKKIAVMGPFANVAELGQYSSQPTKLTSPLSALQTYIDENSVNCEIEYFSGSPSYSSDELYSVTGFTLIMEDGSEIDYTMDEYDAEASSLDVKYQASFMGGASYVQVYDGSVLTIPYASINGAKAIRIYGATTSGCVISITSQGSKTLGQFEISDPIGYVRFDGITGETEELPLTTDGQVDADITFTFSPLPVDFSAESARIAADADVTILFVGADTYTATESNDRETLDFPGLQDEMIRAVLDASDNVILAITSMNMMEVEEYKDDAAAMLWYGFNGQVQGAAVVETLFGDVNPSGRLPFTWYAGLNNLPDIYDYTLTGTSEDGRSTGRTYMYYDGEISYPFGYGLSYTTFKFDNFAVDKNAFSPDDELTFTVDVTNTGGVAGKEVVQLYCSAPNAADPSRPDKQLVGFEKVELAPGETKTVTVTVSAADLWQYEDATGDSLNQEETPMSSGILNTSADLVIDGRLSYLNGEYTFEAADAASNLTNDGDAGNSLKVTAVMNGELTLKLQNVSLETGTPDSGKPQFLNVGDQIATVATIALNNDTFIDPSEASVTYSSNREDVVSVDENGVLTAAAPGVATVTVTVEYNGSSMTGECAVKVL